MHSAFPFADAIKNCSVSFKTAYPATDCSRRGSELHCPAQMSTPVEPNTQEAAIIAEEQEIFDRVRGRLIGNTQVDTTDSRQVAASIDQQLLDLRDAIGEAKPEDHASLVEQMTRLQAIRSKIGGSRTVPIDPESPYFAHMVLQTDKQQDILIGKRGFIDREHRIHVVDWRNAPISQVYYRYDEGDDYEENIAGRDVEGLVEVRRNVSIAGGRLRRIGAPQGTFIRDQKDVWHQAVGEAAPSLRGGQGKASRAPKRTRAIAKGRGRDRRANLGVHHGQIQRADKHMPEIAALIDREQFDLITQPGAGLVVIQGGAGSGKTTVALHRIAYLNFRQPKLFRPKSMLFVVPSRALMRYVAEVLPSLGIHGVPVVTYLDWAHRQRTRVIGSSPQRYNDATPDICSRLKKHPALLKALEALVADQTASAESQLLSMADDMDQGHVIEKSWSSFANKALLPRLRRVYSAIQAAQGNMQPASFNAALALAKRLIARTNDLIGDWSDLLTDKQTLIKHFGSEVSVSEIDKLVSWSLEQSEQNPLERVERSEQYKAADGRALEEDHPRGRFDREDNALLLRLAQLKRGGLYQKDGSETRYHHIAIDEAQDRSAIEIKVLLEATHQQDGPMSRSVTIAGDTAQRLVFDNNFDGWQELLTIVGHAASIVHPLKLSYRSTAEVMQLAQQVLGPELAPKEHLVARSGAPVELHEFGDVGEVVAFLADALRQLANREPTASVALISRYPEQADMYYQGLARADIPQLRRVRNQDFVFTPGFDVTDVAQVKGLEFDYVVLLDVNANSYPETLESRHLLHIGATRAAHQLWITCSGPPSPLVRDV